MGSTQINYAVSVATSNVTMCAKNHTPSQDLERMNNIGGIGR